MGRHKNLPAPEQHWGGDGPTPRRRRPAVARTERLIASATGTPGREGAAGHRPPARSRAQTGGTGYIDSNARESLGEPTQTTVRRVGRPVNNPTAFPVLVESTGCVIGDVGKPDAAATRRRLLKIGGNRVKHDLPTLPGVQSLSRITRFVPGGRQYILELAQMAAQNGDESMLEWWDVFTQLRPREQLYVSFDDVCAASGVRPADFMSAIVSCGMEHGAEISDLMAAALQPEVVRQMGKSAKRIGGQYADIALRDRHELLRHGRFLPIPRNAAMQVNVNTTATANAVSSAKAAAVSVEPSVPKFTDDMASLQIPKERVQRQLIGDE